MTSKISIIVSSYNRMGYLEKAICSLLEQNYPDLEIIVADDHSFDGSWNVICEYTAQHTNIIGVRQSENFGFPTRPRNCGLYLSTGDVIGFLDEDNSFLPGKLTSLTSHLSAGVDIVYCRSQGMKNGRATPVPWSVQPAVFNPELLERRNYIDTSEPLIRRSVFEKAGVFDEELPWVEEWDLWRRFVWAGARFLCIPQKWNSYSIHPQDSRCGRTEIHKGGMMRVAEKFRNLRTDVIRVTIGPKVLEFQALGQSIKPLSEKYQISICEGGVQRTETVEVRSLK